MKTIPSEDSEATKAIGKPKSGKCWKKLSRPARALNTELNSSLHRLTFEQRKGLKLRQQEAKALETSFTETRNRKKREDRERTETKKKQREENDVKNNPFQIIKNTKKIQHWSKKMKSQLMRLPTDVYYREINKRR